MQHGYLCIESALEERLRSIARGGYQLGIVLCWTIAITGVEMAIINQFDRSPGSVTCSSAQIDPLVAGSS
jgi:hypothetical protein